jgi:hypothetical protein
MEGGIFVRKSAFASWSLNFLTPNVLPSILTLLKKRVPRVGHCAGFRAVHRQETYRGGDVKEPKFENESRPLVKDLKLRIF